MGTKNKEMNNEQRVHREFGEGIKNQRTSDKRQMEWRSLSFGTRKGRKGQKMEFTEANKLKPETRGSNALLKSPPMEKKRKKGCRERKTRRGERKEIWKMVSTLTESKKKRRREGQAGRTRTIG